MSVPLMIYVSCPATWEECDWQAVVSIELHVMAFGSEKGEGYAHNEARRKFRDHWLANHVAPEPIIRVEGS